MCEILANDECSIKVLDLSSNKITDKGVVALARMLRVNKSLRTLWIDDNKIGEKGSNALLEALESNLLLDTLVVIDDDDFMDYGEYMDHPLYSYQTRIDDKLLRNDRFMWLKSIGYERKREILLSILRRHSLQDFLDSLMIWSCTKRGSWICEERDYQFWKEYEDWKKGKGGEKSD